MTRLRVALLTDERAGHVRLAEGLVAALERSRPVEVTRLRARRPRYLGGPLALATNAGVQPALILKRIYGHSVGDLVPPDIVVSAGAETLAANIALARHFGRPNLFYGSLRRFRAADFTLAFTSYARQAIAANQIAALKPQPHDPDRVRPLVLPRQATGAGETAVLLLGGPARGYAWRDAEWERLLDLTRETPEAPLRWVIANSRRTPDDISDAALERGRKDPGRIAVVDVRSAAASLAGVLAAGRVVVVTADSSSMVSEAIWMRRPVIAARPADMTHRPDEAAYRAWLAGEGWMIEAAVSDLDAGRVVELSATLRPLAHNPLDALAATLRARLPGLF